MTLFETLETRRLLSVSTANSYVQTNLVTDTPAADNTADPNLINPWGIAAGPTTPFWVADNGTAVSTAYSGRTIVPPTVTIPAGTSSTGGAHPTGVVFNPTSAFKIGPAKHQVRAQYLFAGEDGAITAWQPKVDLNHALIVADNSAQGAVYKGIAIAKFKGQPFAYAANFHSGKIDVFDKNFAPATLPGTFTDPTLPSGFSPFNVQTLKNRIFIAFAQKETNGDDEVAGAGLGFVDAFNTNGQFIARIASQGTLNAPWGMAFAPPSFGHFKNDLLVGNFGDGRINAFNPRTFTFDGQLNDPNGNPITIDGLWGIAFGAGRASGKPNQLFFAAGPGGEAHGVFGMLTASTTTNPTPNPNPNPYSPPMMMLM